MAHRARWASRVTGGKPSGIRSIIGTEKYEAQRRRSLSIHTFLSVELISIKFHKQQSRVSWLNWCVFTLNVNTQFASLLGYKPEELLLQDYRIVYSEQTIDILKKRTPTPTSPSGWGLWNQATGRASCCWPARLATTANTVKLRVFGNTARCGPKSLTHPSCELSN